MTTTGGNGYCGQECGVAISNMATRMGPFGAIVLAEISDPEEYNTTINAKVKKICEDEKFQGFLQEYFRLLSQDGVNHGERVLERLISPSYREELIKCYEEVTGSAETEIEWKDNNITAFFNNCFQYYFLPKAPSKAQYNLLFREFRSEEAKTLTLSESILMIDTVARVIIRLYGLQVMVTMMDRLVKEILESEEFQEMLRRMNVDDVAGLKMKLAELNSDMSWVIAIFKTADVGESGMLSFTTRQVHFFDKKIFEHIGFDGSGKEDLFRKMFEIFALEGSDTITESACILMIQKLIEAFIQALS